ncbi:MAG: M20/M25/M40 family metallo-hydrolase, partial [Clostridia bacterium]|nr:M20/M25/M40 family metallo-hydrolase [Clostridia bacterium]
MSFSQEYLDMCAHKLGQMVRIPTVSKSEDEDLTEFYRLHGLMKELFPRIHEKLERTELRGSLLYRWPSGSDLEPILLMGHQDVVPASDEGWSVGAYSGTVKDGCLYGRGALDC